MDGRKYEKNRTRKGRMGGGDRAGGGGEAVNETLKNPNIH